MAGNLSSDLGQPRTHTSTDAINSTSISLDSSTAETAAAEDIYNEIYADVLQKVSNPTEAMRLMDNLGFAHPCPEQNAVPGSPIHQPVHEFARSQCSPSGEIFLDLLHRTNGDTDAALEIMRVERPRTGHDALGDPHSESSSATGPSHGASPELPGTC
eukprot:jgi/Tetstr1/432565/TSEL_021935.t1